MKRFSAICIAAAASLLHAWGQPADWKSLHSVDSGQRISITTKSGEVIEGRFTGWSPDNISLLRGRRMQSLAFADVRRVDKQQKGSRWRGAMWGALVGFAALFPCGAASAGYIADQNDPRVSTRLAMGAGAGMFGAGIGAAAGALAGTSRFVTIYRTEQRR